jgi:tetratricopeptide (TPR) repeat protein
MSYKNEELLDNADYCIKEGFIDEAVTILNDILMDDPLFGKAHNQLGFIFETKLQDYKRAEEHYSISLRTDPNYHCTYYNAAILYSTLKQYDKLEALLKKAEDVKGIDIAIINNEWAIMYESKGEFNKAIEYYKRVIASTLNDVTISRAIRSIKRCEKKKSILLGEGPATAPQA